MFSLIQKKEKEGRIYFEPDIAVDSQGDIYIAEYGATILRFSADGKLFPVRVGDRALLIFPGECSG